MRNNLPRYVAPGPVYRKARKLSRNEIERLVEGYQGGKTVYELGREFGVHRVTVSAVLKRSGVPMRMQGLSEDDRNEVVRLHGEGCTYADLGRRFHVDPGTVRSALRKAQTG